MRSKTSFFDRAIFRQNVKRFWPLWIAFVAIELLVCAVGCVGGNLRYILTGQSVAERAFNVGETLIDFQLNVGVIMNFVAGLIFAMLIYSYLTNARSAGAFASLPIRRETMFITNYLSGLVIFICGIVVTGGVCLLVQAGSCLTASSVTYVLVWALISVLQFILFYSIAVFISMLTGHIAVTPLLYLVINFLGAALNAILSTVLSMLLYGYSSSGIILPSWMSPAVYMLARSNSISLFDYEAYKLAAGAFENLSMFYIYAAAGIVLAVFALLFYRKRRMENATDVVAVNALRPVFKYCMTFGCALLSDLRFSVSCWDIGKLTARELWPCSHYVLPAERSSDISRQR